MRSRARIDLGNFSHVTFRARTEPNGNWALVIFMQYYLSVQYPSPLGIYPVCTEDLNGTGIRDGLDEARSPPAGDSASRMSQVQ